MVERSNGRLVLPHDSEFEQDEVVIFRELKPCTSSEVGQRRALQSEVFSRKNAGLGVVRRI